MILGQISLNLSFALYLFLYLPQVIHNQKQLMLNELSVWMHILLYTAYFLDSVYGFTQNLPWQYRTVSTMGWILLTIQHTQLIRYFKHTKQTTFQYLFYGIELAFIVIFLWILCTTSSTSQKSFSWLGYVAQIGFVIGFLPQIFKTQRLRSANALSIFYLGLCLFLAILDCISAWQLAWGWSNQLGSLLIVALTTILLLQHHHYRL